MPYYSETDVLKLGFKSVGRGVKVSTAASIYNHEHIILNDYARIDDFCVISGKVTIGKYVHIAPFCLIAGGEMGIVMEDFSGLAYSVQIFSQSDDYSGRTLTNPTIPKQYKHETKKAVHIGKHVIIGAGSIVMPGVVIAEGCSIGAMSLVRKSTEPWGIYLGNPAVKIKNRRQDLLILEQQFLAEQLNSPL
jgi:acetyltransferase-like isoleucine patch superfamily enzyme